MPRFKGKRPDLSQAMKGNLRNSDTQKPLINPGESKHPLYPVYHGMIGRCYNPKYRQYQYLGKKGIEVCERWRGKDGFQNFLIDMGPRPEGQKSGRALYFLLRKNPDDHFCKENCY